MRVRFHLLTAVAGLSALSVAQPMQLSAQDAGVTRIIVRSPQPQPDSLLLVPREAIIFSEGRKLEMIAETMDQLRKKLLSDQQNANSFIKNEAQNVRLLQMQAAGAVLTMHNLCNASSGRPAWLGVQVNGGRIPGVSIAEMRAAGVAPYPTIVRVESASPAAHAGLAGGEKILRVNGEDIGDVELEKFITKPGDKLQLRVAKEGKERDVVVELGANKTRTACDLIFTPNVDKYLRVESVVAPSFRLSPLHFSSDSTGARVMLFQSDSGGIRKTVKVTINRGAAPVAPSLESIQHRNLFGAIFYNPTPAYLERGGAPNGGVAVVHVTANEPSARAGLMSGDIVVRVGRTPVKNLEEFSKAIEADKSGKPLSIDIVRSGRPHTLSISPK